MAGQTSTEKILARHCGRDRVSAGEEHWCDVDVVMMHDVTSSGAIKLIGREFGDRIDKRLRVVVTPDHYVPNKDIKSAISYRELSDFVERQTGKADIKA